MKVFHFQYAVSMTQGWHSLECYWHNGTKSSLLNYLYRKVPKLLCGNILHNLPILHIDHPISNRFQIIQAMFRNDYSFSIVLPHSDNIRKYLYRTAVQI